MDVACRGRRNVVCEFRVRYDDEARRHPSERVDRRRHSASDAFVRRRAELLFYRRIYPHDQAEPMTTDVAAYWQNFLQRHGRNPDERCAGEMSFEAEGFFGDELLALVLAGKKTAFFSSYAAYIIDNEELPASGETYVVLDRSGSPRCIIELTSVKIVPFCEVTREMVNAEGEDESIESWREKEKAYLEDEGAVVGFAFTEDIKLVFHEFCVIN